MLQQENPKSTGSRKVLGEKSLNNSSKTSMEKRRFIQVKEKNPGKENSQETTINLTQGTIDLSNRNSHVTDKFA